MSNTETHTSLAVILDHANRFLQTLPEEHQLTESEFLEVCKIAHNFSWSLEALDMEVISDEDVSRFFDVVDCLQGFEDRLPQGLSKNFFTVLALGGDEKAHKIASRHPKLVILRHPLNSFVGDGMEGPV